MATRILTGHRPPLLVALMHGGAGATGLGLLTWAVLSTGSFGSPGLALSVLGCNALLGFYLFSRHLREKPWPKFAVVTHGFAAAIGFTLIVIFALTRNEKAEADHAAFLQDLRSPGPESASAPPAPSPAQAVQEPAVAPPPTPAPDVAKIELPPSGVDAGPALVPPVKVVLEGNPPPPEVAKVELAPQASPDVAIWTGAKGSALPFPARFAHNQVEPSEVDADLLDGVGAWLASCSGVVKVVGHTSAAGSLEGNYFVGLGRAIAVRKYLHAHGLTRRRVRVESAGGKAEGNVGTRSVMLLCE